MTESDTATNYPRVILLAPGCFTPLQNSHPEAEQTPAAELTEELNHASVIENDTQSYEQALLTHFGQGSIDLGDLPVAQHRFSADTGTIKPAHCVCAEFVHLQADIANARLIPSSALSISDDERTRLIEALNELIGADGLNAIECENSHMYLTGMPAAALDTWPAHTLATGKIANYLPRQTDAGDWRRLLTEVQMLLHAHPVNAVRADRQQLAINAMWFWGGRELATIAPGQEIRLIATDTFSVGLATELNIPVLSQGTFDFSDNQGDVVIVELGVYKAWLSGDQEALLQAKKQLSAQWIEPAQKAVAAGFFSEFVLDSCEGQAIVETAKSGRKATTAKCTLMQSLFSAFGGKGLSKRSGFNGTKKS